MVRIMACHLFGARPLSKPRLGNCKLDPRNKLQGYFNKNKTCFIHENASENIICKMVAILSRGGKVNTAVLAYHGVSRHDESNGDVQAQNADGHEP